MNLTTGRFVEPQEIADAVAYLASPRSGSTTGAECRRRAGCSRRSDGLDHAQPRGRARGTTRRTSNPASPSSARNSASVRSRAPSSSSMCRSMRIANSRPSPARAGSRRRRAAGHARASRHGRRRGCAARPRRPSRAGRARAGRRPRPRDRVEEVALDEARRCRARRGLHVPGAVDQRRVDVRRGGPRIAASRTPRPPPTSTRLARPAKS